MCLRFCNPVPFRSPALMIFYDATLIFHIFCMIQYLSMQALNKKEK